MIFEALRRRWSGYFRPRATSVSPQISEDAIIDRMMERGAVYVRKGESPTDALKRYVLRGGRPEDVPGWNDTRIAHAVQIESGAVDERPGIEPPANEMPWPQWRALEAELDAPLGWSACRFPTWKPGTLPGQDQGTCGFVFGITRGAFGIWRTPFPVCVTDDDGMATDKREDVLAAITHLPTGLGMGVFADRAAAIALCHAVESVGDWHTRNVSAAMQIRFHEARSFCGVWPSRTRHAHMGSADGPLLAIWEQRAEDVAAGRPEKLS